MDQFLKSLKFIERFIVITLIVFMSIVLVLASVEVGIVLFNKLSNPFDTNGIIINVESLLEIFEFFLTVLIGFELFETVRLYLKENVFHGEIILLVGLIAITRKVIVLDYSKEDPLTLFAMAALIISISIGYYLIKRACGTDSKNTTFSKPKE